MIIVTFYLQKTELKMGLKFQFQPPPPSLKIDIFLKKKFLVQYLQIK